MTLEERCCAALESEDLSSHVRIDVFDDVLKAVEKLVEDERAAEVESLRTFINGAAHGYRLAGNEAAAEALSRLSVLLRRKP